MIDEKTKRTIMQFQKNEITEYFIYRVLSRLARSEHNRRVLKKISDEEMRHYQIWHKYSGEKVRPDSLKRIFYITVSAIFGVTFGIKLMENGEGDAQVSYAEVSKTIPEAEEIRKEESDHEDALIRMIDEERLAYLGSMVLGLNDALVEFTGALAGFTFALRQSRLIAMTGLIMGLSASLSMAASEYLSTKTEAQNKDPRKASLYTGVAYVITVVILVSPFIFFTNSYLSLAVTLIFAVLLIAVFTFYSSVVRTISFRGRFLEMLTISMGVAALSFLVGFAVKNLFPVSL